MQIIVPCMLNLAEKYDLFLTVYRAHFCNKNETAF